MKNILCKLRGIILIIVFCIFTVNFFSPLNASAKPQKSNVVVFINNKIPDQALELIEKEYPKLNATTIPEIGTIKFNDKSQNYEVNKAIEEIKHSFQNEIEFVGTDTPLKLPNPSNIGDKYIVDSLISSKEVRGLNSNQGDLPDQYKWDIQKVTNYGESYKKQLGNHNVKIGIIDSGIDFNHPDLKNNIISKGTSFVPDVSETNDNMGHGTMVAGNIAANGQMLGIGPNLGIIPYKVMDKWEDGAESIQVINAIIKATDDNVDVINISLGTYKSLNKPEDRAVVEAYQRAIKYAYKNGTIIVASAGNDGYDITNPSLLAVQMGLNGDKQVHLPGGNNSPFIFNVSATNKADKLSSYSNFGNITVSAPGGDYGDYWTSEGLIDPSELVLTTYPTNLPKPYISEVLGLPDGYTLNLGTSLAAPKISGAVGVLLAESKDKEVNNFSLHKVEKILRKSSVDLGTKGKDAQFGYGRLDLNKALELVK